MLVATISADQIFLIGSRRAIAAKPNISTSTTKPTHNTPKPKTTPSTRHVKRYQCHAQQLRPELSLVNPGCPVAFDCEGLDLLQETGTAAPASSGRLSMVNTAGQII